MRATTSQLETAKFIMGTWWSRIRVMHLEGLYIHADRCRLYVLGIESGHDSRHLKYAHTYTMTRFMHEAYRIAVAKRHGSH